MANIDNVISSINSLKDNKREIEFFSTRINELQEQKEILIKELPTLEEELIFWKNDLKKLEQTNRESEELQTWKDEINRIKQQIKKKKKEIETNKNDLKKELKTKKKLNECLKTLILDTKKLIFNILRQKNFEEAYSDNDLILLTEILKETLETESKHDICSFIDILLYEKIEISLTFLELINRVFGEDLIIIPEIITKFIADYLNDLKSGKLLDPWPTNGFMLKSLSLETHNNDFFIPKKTEYELFQKLFKDSAIEIGHDKSNYDYIVGYPLSDDNDAVNLLNISQRLNDDGEGLFIISQNFLLKRTPESVFSRLTKSGIYIKAIIEVPYNLIFDKEDKILIFITRKPQKDVFIGSLTIDHHINKILKNNLIKKQAGKIPQYGYITCLNSFYTFKSFYAQIESLKINADLNLSTTSFFEIVKEINLPSTNPTYVDKPNSLYLPLEETLEVEVDPEKTKESNYIQIVLNEEDSLAEYLSIYLNNTSLGWKIRESSFLGPYTESLFCDIIKNVKLHIPDLNSQIEVLRVDSIISDIASRAAFHRDQLWKKPNEYSLIIKEIESLDEKSEYHFEQWVESLPFPLASILWESFSTSKPDLKVKYLLHFFEAFSEFNVILLLSGLISDERFFNNEFYRCTQFNPIFKNWFERPSFGNWNFFGQCLGKTLQYILRKQYKRNQLLNIFGNTEPEFLNLMSSYELNDVFGEVNRHRNSWDAHGPVVSTQEYENRFKILRNSISKIYNGLGNIFEYNMLVLPTESTYNEGIYHYTVKKFMGSRNRFKSIEIDTISPMDSNNIYLILGNHEKPIELLPLLKFYKKSCYFYNSLKKDESKTQFVSYHNKELPEISCSLEKLEQFYSLFERDTYYKKY